MSKLTKSEAIGLFYLGTFQGWKLKDEKEKNRLTHERENVESLHSHLHKQAQIKHVDADKALKLDRTSLAKNRCAFFSLPSQ